MIELRTGGETSTETHAAAAAAAAQARLPPTFTAADSNQTQARISILNSAGGFSFRAEGI